MTVSKSLLFFCVSQTLIKRRFSSRSASLLMMNLHNKSLLFLLSLFFRSSQGFSTQFIFPLGEVLWPHVFFHNKGTSVSGQMGHLSNIMPPPDSQVGSYLGLTLPGVVAWYGAQEWDFRDILGQQRIVWPIKMESKPFVTVVSWSFLSITWTKWLWCGGCWEGTQPWPITSSFVTLSLLITVSAIPGSERVPVFNHPEDASLAICPSTPVQPVPPGTGRELTP